MRKKYILKKSRLFSIVYSVYVSFDFRQLISQPYTRNDQLERIFFRFGPKSERTFGKSFLRAWKNVIETLLAEQEILMRYFRFLQFIITHIFFPKSFSFARNMTEIHLSTLKNLKSPIAFQELTNLSKS